MASDATPQAIGEHDDLKPIHARGLHTTMFDYNR